VSQTQLVVARLLECCGSRHACLSATVGTRHTLAAHLAGEKPTLRQTRRSRYEWRVWWAVRALVAIDAHKLAFSHRCKTIRPVLGGSRQGIACSPSRPGAAPPCWPQRSTWATPHPCPPSTKRRLTLVTHRECGRTAPAPSSRANGNAATARGTRRRTQRDARSSSSWPGKFRPLLFPLHPARPRMGTVRNSLHV